MNYNSFVIELKKTYDGEAEALLLQATDNNSEKLNILYLPGFNDYYFHDHVAEHFQKNNYNFYALDLRRYGRARKSHQKQFFIKSIEEYFEEIGKALKIIQQNSTQGTFILGHSTGGLTASLFVNKFQREYNIRGLILNSPFFDFALPKKTMAQMVLMSKLSPIMPFFKVPKPKGAGIAYAMSLHKKHKGEWDYNFAYKPKGSTSVYIAWVAAILNAQKQLQKGLNMDLPVFLMHSDKSLPTRKWNPKSMVSDIILDVEHMKKYGPGVSNDVTFYEATDALHDIYLSKIEVREKALKETINWLSKYK